MRKDIMWASRLGCSVAAPMMALLSILVAGCGSSAPTNLPQLASLELEAADGHHFSASFLPVPAPNPPSLILVPGMGEDPAAWDFFARYAQRAGMSSLVVPIRHTSKEGDRGEEERVLRATLADLDTAQKVLIERTGNPHDVALVGAKEGANLVLHYAAEHTDIPAVVLISPAMKRAGISAEEDLLRHGKRPVLLMTSLGDSYSAMSCRTLYKMAPGFCELREYDGGARGIRLLEQYEQARGQVILWLSQIIGPRPGS